jgi:hypothetical protein
MSQPRKLTVLPGITHNQSLDKARVGDKLLIVAKITSTQNGIVATMQSADLPPDVEAEPVPEARVSPSRAALREKLLAHALGAAMTQHERFRDKGELVLWAIEYVDLMLGTLEAESA